MTRTVRTIAWLAVTPIVCDLVVQACRLISVRAQYRPEHRADALAAILERAVYIKSSQ